MPVRAFLMCRCVKRLGHYFVSCFDIPNLYVVCRRRFARISQKSLAKLPLYLRMSDYLIDGI